MDLNLVLNIQLDDSQLKTLTDAISSLNEPDWMQWIHIISLFIAGGTLIYSVIVNRQDIARHEKQVSKEFATEFNDFLYSINHLYELYVNLKNTMVILESNTNDVHVLEKVRDDIFRIAIEIAHLQGNKVDYAGGIIPKIDRDWRKIPLKNVNEIHALSLKVDTYSRRRNDMDYEEIKEAVNSIFVNLESLFNEFKEYIYVERS